MRFDSSETFPSADERLIDSKIQSRFHFIYGYDEFQLNMTTLGAHDWRFKKLLVVGGI